MPLAIDASSPAVATQTTNTVATVVSGSFTPPANSVLQVLWSGDALGTPAAPSITDSLGIPLTYTRSDWQSIADTPGAHGQAASWTAPVGSSPAAMTVTVTSGSASGERTAALKVLVWTGADTVNPVSAHGKSGSVSASSIAQTYSALATAGQGVIGVCDFDQIGAQTAGTGCTLVASANVSTSFTYGFTRRTTADDTSGSNTTLNVTIPGTSTNLTWVYVEMSPAAASGQVATVPAFVVVPGQGLVKAAAMNRVAPQILGGPVVNVAPLSATVGFTGSRAVAVASRQAAQLGFTGATTRALARTLTAATLSFTGILTLRTSRAFAATVAFTGAVSSAAVHHFTQALSATLAFVGTTTRAVSVGRSATVGFTGTLARGIAHTLAATLAFVGVLSRRTASQQPATVSFTGTRTARTARTLTATVSFTGSLATQAVHFFTKALSATAGFTGNLPRTAGKALSATFGFAGALPRRASPTLSAVLGFVGSQARRVFSQQAAVLGLTATVTRRTVRTLSATLLFTGSVATRLNHLFLKVLSATVGFVATTAQVRPPSWTARTFDSSTTVAGEREPGPGAVGGTDQGGTTISGVD